jgi:phosphatidate cytidylyltransferase
MNKKELKKRIITSIFLLTLLFLMFSYTYIMIIASIIIGVISWVEFYLIISKIFKKESFKNRFLRFIYKSISLLYLSILIYFILSGKINKNESEIFIIYSILISIMSDTGGLITGMIFKGKKLTKISPNKTISGAIGSFFFSLCLIPFFTEYLINLNLILILIFTLTISLASQLGDLFISYLKRKAKIKDTSNLLPGHGGILDRIDGIILSVPVGFLLFSYF